MATRYRAPSSSSTGGDAMEATTTQSAAEDEEDLLLLQQEHQQRHTAASSAFSTSSVDRFLRDNGFQIDEMDDDDDVLSSSADGDQYSERRGSNPPQEGRQEVADDEAVAAAARTGDGLLRVDTSTGDTRRHSGRADEMLSSDGSPSVGSGGSSNGAAAGEGDRPTPRFILLDDEDFLSVAHQSASPSASAAESSVAGTTPRLRQPDASATANPSSPVRLRKDQTGVTHAASFDRSLLFGGSGLSALSEDSQVSYQRGPNTGSPHFDQRTDATTDPHQAKEPRVESVARLLSSSPSSSSSSFSISRNVGKPVVNSSSLRSQDDELSDALGVGSSLSPHPPASSTTSTTHHRQKPRRLSHHEEEEKTASADPPQTPPTHRAATNPWGSSLHEDTTQGSDDEVNVANQKAQWADLNILLRKNGLPAVHLRDMTVLRGHSSRPSHSTEPDHASLINLVQGFLLQLDQKNETIQDLVINSNRTSKVQDKADDNLASLESKCEQLRKSLQSAQSEIKRLQDESRRQKDESEKQVKTIKGSCLKLQQQLKVSEHRVKAKEVLVERMQKKLQQQVDKENLNKVRDRRVFKQLQQREPRKANAKDNQSLECIGIYESQREQMQDEIDHLRNQVAALNGELRDKENSLSRRSSFHHESASASGHWSESSRGDGSKMDPADEMLVRLEAARREQEQATAKLRQRESIMVKKITAIEQELLAAREAIAELKDENANLAMEAESRPSIRDYRLSQRRIHQLERQLSENKLALEEANDINELRRFMGTTDLIERDRLNHRLHLNRLSTLPKETLLEVVKEVCRVLNLTDITLITPSLHKLCNVVTAVPRMEKFIRDVCGFVYFNNASNGHDHEENHDARFELEQVVPTLQQWMVERKKLFELEGFKAAVVTELCKRSVEPSLLKSHSHHANNGGEDEGTTPTPLSSLPRAVHIVAELVELEKSVLHHREIYTQAAEELERRPAVLVNQIVRHFSHLFHIKSVDGVLPKINQVYLFVNEMENFLKAVRSLLDLQSDASLPVCIDKIRSLMEGDTSRAPHQDTQHRRSGDDEKNDDHENESPNYVVNKSTRGHVGVASGGVEGVRQVRQMAVLVRDLKKELGAATMDEILPRTRRLMELLSLSVHQTPADPDF